MYGTLKVFAGKAGEHLIEPICDHLDITPGKANIFKFKNDNTFVQIQENVRECDVFLIQSSAPPVDEHLMQTLLMIDALKRASAARITAVLPYYPYVRSDKKDQPRVPISARLVADLLTTAGADRVITLDLHAAQIQGFFSRPVDHLTSTPLFCDYIKRKGIQNPVAVACDAGAAKKAFNFSRGIQAPLAIMEKQRLGNTETVEMTAFIGDVQGRHAIIFEDEISSGGTVVKAVEILKTQGASQITVCAPHAVFCDNALHRLARCGIDEIIVTDSVPHPRETLSGYPVTRLSVAQLLAEAIHRVHSGESVSDLFQDY